MRKKDNRFAIFDGSFWQLNAASWMLKHQEFGPTFGRLRQGL